MQALKLKVGKTGFLCFNGEYITEGTIIFRKELGKVSDARVQVLIDTNVKFDRSPYDDTLRVNDDAKLPDLRSTLVEDANAEDAKITNQGLYGIIREQWVVRIESCENPDKHTYVKEHFVRFIEPMLHDGNKLKVSGSKEAVMIVDSVTGIVEVAVMPVRVDVKH